MQLEGTEFQKGKEKNTGRQKPTRAFRGVAVLNQVHLTMMLVVFYLPVRLESGSFIISHKIISVDVISTTNGKIHYNAIDK